MKTGRPTKYSLELADKICERLAAGESMRSISRDPGMPACSSMFKWIREHEEFSVQYDKAKEESADALLEDMFDIADNANNDWMEKHGESEGYMQNGEAIQRSRLRVDVRKWAASKLKPKKYGDKQEIKHSGSIGLKEISQMTDEELENELNQ